MIESCPYVRGVERWTTSVVRAEAAGSRAEWQIARRKRRKRRKRAQVSASERKRAQESASERMEQLEYEKCVANSV